MISGGGLSFFRDIAEEVGRFFARGGGRKKEFYKGTVGSPAFWADAHLGDAAATDTIDFAGYKYAWKQPGMQGAVEREMTRFHRGPRVPGVGVHLNTGRWKGALFGRPVVGYSRARSNFSRPMIKVAVGLGVPMALWGVATAERGHAASAVASVVGGTVGGVTGSAVGAFFAGLPGELIGGYVGGELGDKAGDAYDTALEAVHNIRRVNAGGHYTDTQVAYTMRQRAVQELSSSLLNARQYLGKEALLLHQ